MLTIFQMAVSEVETMVDKQPDELVLLEEPLPDWKSVLVAMRLILEEKYADPGKETANSLDKISIVDPRISDLVIDFAKRTEMNSLGDGTLFGDRKLLMIGSHPDAIKEKVFPFIKLLPDLTIMGGREQFIGRDDPDYLSLQNNADDERFRQFDYVMMADVIATSALVSPVAMALNPGSKSHGRAAVGNADLLCLCGNFLKKGGKIVHVNSRDACSSPALDDGDLHEFMGIKDLKYQSEWFGMFRVFEKEGDKVISAEEFSEFGQAGKFREWSEKAESDLAQTSEEEMLRVHRRASEVIRYRGGDKRTPPGEGTDWRGNSGLE